MPGIRRGNATWKTDVATDTGGNSSGGGTNNQQSTQNTETVAMTAMTITMETKGTAVAAEAWGQRPAWRRRRQLGKTRHWVVCIGLCVK